MAAQHITALRLSTPVGELSVNQNQACSPSPEFICSRPICAQQLCLEAGTALHVRGEMTGRSLAMMRKALAVSEKPLKTRPMVPKSAPRPAELRSSSTKPVSAMVLSDRRFSSAVRLRSRKPSARCSASLLSSACKASPEAFRNPGPA